MRLAAALFDTRARSPYVHSMAHAGDTDDVRGPNQVTFRVIRLT